VPEIVYILVSELHNIRYNLFGASLNVATGIRVMPPLQSSIAEEEFPINANKSYDSISSKVNGDSPPIHIHAIIHSNNRMFVTQ
jgi:hypothetical protein